MCDWVCRVVIILFIGVIRIMLVLVLVFMVVVVVLLWFVGKSLRIGWLW